MSAQNANPDLKRLDMYIEVWAPVEFLLSMSGVCQVSVRYLSGICQVFLGIVRCLSGVCQVCRVFVRYLSGICQVSVRYVSGFLSGFLQPYVRAVLKRYSCNTLHLQAQRAAQFSWCLWWVYLMVRRKDMVSWIPVCQSIRSTSCVVIVATDIHFCVTPPFR